MFRKLTPVIIVEAIEPCLELWLDRLGFAITAEAPEGCRAGFVILEKDGVELMYQTRSSLAADTGIDVPEGTPGTALFIQVESPLDEVISKLGDYPVAVSRRRYASLLPERSDGMDEIGVWEPGGTLVFFGCPLPRDPVGA
jgi:hypothetical protein